MLQHRFDFEGSDFLFQSVSPHVELGAYETIWLEPRTTFKTVANKFRGTSGSLPSDFVDRKTAIEMANSVLGILRAAGVKRRMGVQIHGAGEYPQKLRDAAHPVELLYFQGWWNLVETPCIAVVGSRKASEDGLKRTRKLVRQLVGDGWTIVSGLGAGVDTEAHRAALESGGFTIAVIGTPLCDVYPKQNEPLQKEIAERCLVISQVPVERYRRQDWRANRGFFPERNKTMSALAEATIIVEAGDTSGTLIQARAALQQGRKLFILDSCFRNPSLTWPARFQERGAIRVSDFDQIREELKRDAN